MAKLQYTRYEVICSTREEALEKLRSLSRSYAEPVAIRYKAPNNDVYTIVAIYQSTSPGDFEITYETGSMGLGRVFKITRTRSTQTDQELIVAAMFGEVAQPLDIVIIEEKSSASSTSYVYYNSEWNMLWQGAASETTKFEDSDTVKFSSTETSETGVVVKAEVPIDNETLTVDPGTKKLRVTKIYGGTF